jgi:integrase/recombinase XerC
LQPRLQVDDALASSFNDALEDFLVAMHARGRSEKTVLFYRSRLSVVIAWAIAHHVTISGFSKRHMERFASERRAEGLAPVTVFDDQLCMRTFLKWCADEGYIKASHLLEYRICRPARAKIRVPSTDEMMRFVEGIATRWDVKCNPKVRKVAPAERRFLWRRDDAILSTLIETTARIGEVLGMSVDDIQPGCINVTAKGAIPRSLPITPSLEAVYAAYLKERPSDVHEKLFITVYGDPLDYRAFNDVFHAYRTHAGLEHFTPHALRHYSITKLAQSAGVVVAAHQAGHTNLTTTQRYVEQDPEFNRSRILAADILGKLRLNKPNNQRETVDTRARKRVV